MSRRKKKPTRRVKVPIEKLNAIVERTRTEPLAEADHATLKAAVDTLARLTAELESTQTTLARVQRIAFGAPTETTATVLGEDKTTAASPGARGEASPPAAADTPPQGKAKGHGRNGAQDYPRAVRIPVAHATLQHGDPCPEPGCNGRLYLQRQEPAVLVRVTGVAPLQAQVYELDRLRCGLCGTVFTAEPPAGVGAAKYDETAAAMIALLKYGRGLPFHRVQHVAHRVLDDLVLQGGSQSAGSCPDPSGCGSASAAGAGTASTSSARGDPAGWRTAPPRRPPW